MHIKTYVFNYFIFLMERFIASLQATEKKVGWKLKR